MLLKDKVVIVSGIGPGLGQELSTLAAQEGASAVVLAARTAAKLDVAEQEIKDLGLGTEFSRCHGYCRSGPVPGPGGRTAAGVRAHRCAVQQRLRSGQLRADRGGQHGRLAAGHGCQFLWHHASDPGLCSHMKDSGGGAIVMIATMVEHKPLATQGGYGSSKSPCAAPPSTWPWSWESTIFASTAVTWAGCGAPVWRVIFAGRPRRPARARKN